SESATGLSADENPKPLTEIAEDENLLVFDVTNDMLGYVVPPNDFVLHPTQAYLRMGTDRFGKSHYHETKSLGIFVQETIANIFSGMVKRMK
ncbi:MAG: hypothetical protein LUH40_00335, partial [Clostridiales bacterium]|nr:hypothetical protein [Clostridiales bacterium]